MPGGTQPPAAGPGSPQPIAWRDAWRLVAAAGRAAPLRQAGFAVAMALLPLAGLLAMQQLIDAVAAGIAGRLAPDAAMSAATMATLLAGGVALVGGLVRSAAAVATERDGRALADAGAASVQAHTSRLDLAAFDRPAFHDLLLRAGAEASQRPVRLLQDGVAVLGAGLGLVVMVALLAGVAPWLPLLVAATALPLAWIRARHARQRAAWQEGNVGAQRDLGYAGAVLTGRATAKDVRALGLAGFWQHRAETLRRGLRASLGALATRRARDELLVHTLGSAGLFAAYLVLAREALAGGLTLGGLVLQAQAAQRAQNAVRDLLAALAAVHENRLLLRPVVDFAALRPELEPGAAAGAPRTQSPTTLAASTIATAGPRGPSVAAASRASADSRAREPGGTTPPPGATPPPGPLALALRGVAFAYPESPHPALLAATAAIAAGERVAVVGPNGSGKSTLVKLLCRLYAPSGGSLHGGGVDLAAIDPVAWRARVAVLLQDATLFELSVRDNLALGGSGEPTDAALWTALGVVGLDERVRALPRGLDTMCSRRHAGGVDWSAGEARRLLLARALAQPADLRLLDEPFLALDGVAADRLGAHLAAAPRTATTVLVDHRPQALRCVDRVLVLERGRIVASGPPAELAREHAGFRALFAP